MSKFEVAVANLFAGHKINAINSIDNTGNKVKVNFADGEVYLYEWRADIDLVLVYRLVISKLVYNSRVYEVERIGELTNFLHVKHNNGDIELEISNHEHIFHEPVHSFI